MPTPTFDQPAADRWFAVEFNNAAWDIVEAKTRSHVDVERMLNFAHAAFCHWERVGNPINTQRAYDLLAQAHARSPEPKCAVRYAEAAVRLSEEHPEAQSSFDLASVATSMASSLSAAGETEQAAEWKAKAAVLIAALEADERMVLERLLM